MVARVLADYGEDIDVNGLHDDWEWSDEMPSLPYSLYLQFESESLTIIRLGASARASLSTPESGGETPKPVAWASKEAMHKLRLGSPCVVDHCSDLHHGVDIPLYASPPPVSAPSVGVKEIPCDSQSRAALQAVVAAWENTKSGQTNRSEIQRWLIEDMKPAIDAARSVIAAKAVHADDLAVDRFAPR